MVLPLDSATVTPPEGAGADKVTVQEGPWVTNILITFNTEHKHFEDIRVRQALTLAIDRWGGSTSLGKISLIKGVGGAFRLREGCAQVSSAADRRVMHALPTHLEPWALQLPGQTARDRLVEGLRARKESCAGEQTTLWEPDVPGCWMRYRQFGAPAREKIP